MLTSDQSSMDKRDERKRTYRRSIEKAELTVKTETSRSLRDKHNGYLFIGYAAVVVKKA